MPVRIAARVGEHTGAAGGEFMEFRADLHREFAGRTHHQYLNIEILPVADLECGDAEGHGLA